MSAEKYYSTDLVIPAVEIKAESRQEADAIIREFVEKIPSMMGDRIRWGDPDWTVEENVLDEAEGVWKTN